MIGHEATLPGSALDVDILPHQQARLDVDCVPVTQGVAGSGRFSAPLQDFTVFPSKMAGEAGCHGTERHGHNWTTRLSHGGNSKGLRLHTPMATSPRGSRPLPAVRPMSSLAMPCQGCRLAGCTYPDPAAGLVRGQRLGEPSADSADSEFLDECAGRSGQVVGAESRHCEGCNGSGECVD
jgi:hypothetical protein